MNTKEKHDKLKKDMAKLLTEKKMLELRIKEINEEFESMRKEMLDIKMQIYIEEKENMKKL